MKNSKDEIQLEKDLLIETLKAKVKHYKKKLAKIKKQLSLCSVVKSFYCNNEVIGLKTQCKDQCKECSKWMKTAFKQ